MEEEVPSSKRSKICKEEDSRHQQLARKMSLPKCSDFMVSHLEDFYKPNPPFRLPVEIGSFSFDSEGEMVLDRSGLRYFFQPPKLGLNLKVGFDQFERKLNQTPNLNAILTWVSHNWNCFLPKLTSQSSVEGSKPDDMNAAVAMTTTTSTETTPRFLITNHKLYISTYVTVVLYILHVVHVFMSCRHHQRPDNLLTDFICWRGLMTKLLCTPYNKVSITIERVQPLQAPRVYRT